MAYGDRSIGRKEPGHVRYGCDHKDGMWRPFIEISNISEIPITLWSDVKFSNIGAGRECVERIFRILSNPPFDNLQFDKGGNL